MNGLTARHGLQGLAGAVLVVTTLLASLTNAAAQAVGGLAALPGTGTIVANPYGAMSAQGASISGNTISNLQPNVTIQLGATAGAADSYAKIDFQGFNWDPGTVLTIRSGAAGQKLVLYNVLAAASSISGTLLAQGGNGAPAPAIHLWSPSGFAIGPGGTVTAPSGLTLDALGNTWTTGQDIVNAGSIDGGSSLILRGANIKGGGVFKGNSTVVATFGSANNPVNGAHYLANGLQLLPSTGSDVLLTLNDYGNAPQYINVKVYGNARLSMPSVWPNGSTLPPNNLPVPAGGLRPAGVPDPTYGAGSSVFQATGSMTLDKGTSNDFVFPGGIVLKSGGTLDLNGVTINQGWTTNGQAFQGTYFESPNVVSSTGNIQLLTNNLNWVNFSTMPQATVRTWTLARAADGSARYIPADSVAPHLNAYSILIEAAAAGQCWVCLVNNLPVGMGGAPPPPSVPICSITPSQTVSVGTSVTLALANCSPGTGLTYSWNQGSPTGPQVSTGPTYTTPLLTTTANYFGTVSANGSSTTYQTTVTVNGTTAPPPVSGSCSGYAVVDLGDLSFDGRRIMTDGVTGSAVVYGRIVVPNPLPGGWSGKVSSIAVFEYLDPQYSKKMYVTKTPCDFSPVWPAYGEGNSINVMVSFQNPLYNAVNVNAGDVWYLTVKNERMNGAPSCANGASCNFALTLSAPSAP